MVVSAPVPIPPPPLSLCLFLCVVCVCVCVFTLQALGDCGAVAIVDDPTENNVSFDWFIFCLSFKARSSLDICLGGHLILGVSGSCFSR